MGMEVPVKRRRGMPKRRWLDNIRNDLSERELSGEEAQGRVKWRRLIRNIDHHIKSGKDVDEEGSYSRTPILRPPSKSDWSGRKRGVVVHEGLAYFITCALWYTRI